MKETACHWVQENIASGVHLPAHHQHHLSACAPCQEVNEQYRQLEAMFALDDVSIPDGFADSVMARIGSAPEAGRRDWLIDLHDRVAHLAVRPLAQWVLLSFALMMSVFNLMRFVFFLLTPAY
jgi:hypothetical protein